ncbi:hypothetical protein PYCCODRAFT_1406322 [Trametes coccinea BRFM310]|uniref:Uncharacterized protein n=1 Tax=Trametes coccinea (strain BRFM310) TaxID=1353009 RepID=A0A1Y2IV33_TRAC3|nr:hypothetical protein PYCCODRAFT_1406322 [Trametes coccinea BRFM310]
MSHHAQSNSSPFSRLSRLAFPFRSNPSSPLTAETQGEDWYIPYNGPVEPPPPRDDRNTDSWGHLVSGWLMENEGDSRTERSARPRALSNASRVTAAGVGGEEPPPQQRRKGSRPQPSYVNLDQAGGVGDTPVPARPRRSQEAPLHHRASLASILSFGNKKAAHKQLQHSSSAGDLNHKHADRDREHGSPLSHPAPEPSSGFLRRHPYAYATPVPSAPPPPVSSPVVTVAPHKPFAAPRFSVRLLDPLAEKPTAPAYLLPARRPSRLSLKASMSTPNLRQATGTVSVLPKGKQRWLSAETWCDALILPRPRFALKVMDEEGNISSGRIVSPPASPIWPPGMEPPLDAAGKALKKSHSAFQLRSREHASSPPRRPEPVQEESVSEQPVPGPSRVIPETVNANTHLKPPRPKSFALDDLALPSPVPSLSKVLEDGRQLEEERKTWQRQAAKSSMDRRARSMSRARSKSLGSRAPAHAREHQSAFEVLAEATLLGSQKRRPTVHVRVRPPRSDGHATTSGYGTTASGTGMGTWTSASHGQTQTQTRSRGHAHSNSVGTVSQPRSDESFMWTPGHGRNHSFGKSALRMVRTTAATAAGLCGVAGGHESDEDRAKGKPPMSEKANAMEEALKGDGTKVLHLRDQLPRRREDQARDTGGVVVITPPADTAGRLGEHHAGVGPSGTNGVSPTPSAQTTSGEGVGIAISSPPAEESVESEPIRIPAHPYAQGATYPFYQRNVGRAPILPSVRAARSDSSAAPSPTSTTGEESVTKHRQPIVAHPYSPYKQVTHPYAAITGTPNEQRPEQRQTPRARTGRLLEVRPPQSRMFAELAPGEIREILPDEIQYSPYIPTPPVRLPESSSSQTSNHPYSGPPPTKRTSEWGFADALAHTMRRPASIDSGLGTSENQEFPDPEKIKISHVLDSADDDVVVISPEEEHDEEDLNALSPASYPSGHSSGGRYRPGLARGATLASSNHTLASSPMENINPPVFRKELSTGQLSHASSGSSPGVVSQQSSPPMSPRPIDFTEDLERFRDLFYQPPESRTPSSDDSRPAFSRRPSSSIAVELNARSTRTLSGLTSLARQLNENMEEMEAYETLNEGYGRASPMWGARHGGLEGRRPEDLGPEPSQVLSQSPPNLVYEREGKSPMRLPMETNVALSQPSDNVPEDVESSRASSMLELPLEDGPEHLRMGEIEAVSTPPVFATEKRFSTHLSTFRYPDEPTSPTTEPSPHRVVSTQSSLGVPHSSDAARSSFMTNTSGMSGLSDFPAPPSHDASHLSILNAYYGEGARRYNDQFDPARPGLVRETSQATFGAQQMGEAL